MAWSQIANQAGKYTFATGGKYCDRDIELTIPTGTIATVTGTAINGTGSATITSMTVGTKASGKYPFTGSATISGSNKGTASVTGGTAGWITSSTKSSGTVTGTISGTASLNASLKAASVTISGSGTAAKPTIAAVTASDNISVGTITTTKPTSGYYAAVAGTSPATTAALSSTTTTGYLGDASTEVSVPTTINIATSGTGLTYYLPITSATTGSSNTGTAVSTITPSGSTQYANITEGYTSARKWTVGPVTLDIAKTITGNGSISASASDPGDSYTANTTTAISSGGYLKIDAGWIPNTKISLATLIGDDIEDITTTTASGSMKAGFRAYDVDGSVLLGSMAEIVFPTAISSTGTGTTKATVSRSTSDQYINIPAGYSDSAVNYKVSATPNAATPALSITDSITTITPAAISGNTSYYNITTSVTGKTTYGTAGYIATSGLSAATDSSATVGRIIAGVITNNTSGGTSKGTIPLGKQIKVAAGWYPSDLYYTAATADTGTAAVITASGAATGVNTSTTATSYYVTPRANTSTSGYAIKDTTTATGTAVYLATTSLTNAVTANSFSIDGESSTNSEYATPESWGTLHTSNSDGVYLDLVGYGTGTVNSVLTSNNTAAKKYLEVYTGTYTIS